MWATKSGLTSGMHHCCFCHGLRVFFQTQAHRLVGQGFHQAQFHRLAGQCAQRPVVMPLGSRGAGQGDQMRSGPVVQLAVPVGLGPVSLSTPSSPSSAKRRLMRNTLDSATSRAWATLGADQPSPVLSRMRARAATRAGLLPARTRCGSGACGPGPGRAAVGRGLTALRRRWVCCLLVRPGLSAGGRETGPGRRRPGG